MKYLKVLLITIFLWQGSSASPDLNIFDIIGQAAQGFENAVETAGGIASGVAGAAGNITKGIVDAGTGITQGFINGTTSITSGLAQRVQQASTAIGERISNITASFREAIANIRDNISGGIFQTTTDQISNRLAHIEEKLNNTLSKASEKYNEAISKVNETLTSSVSNLESWSTQQQAKLEKASDENQQKGKELLNDFYLNSTQKLLNCSIEAVQPIQDLHNQTQSAVNASLPILNNIVDQARTCTNERPINIFRVTSCIINVRRQLPSATGINTEATSLLLKIATVNTGSVQNSGCFAQASADIEQGKSNVASQIDQLAAE